MSLNVCICAFVCLCSPEASLLLQVNIKMREIVEKELKMKQHLLESPSHQKVTASVEAVCVIPLCLSLATSSLLNGVFLWLCFFLTGCINCQVCRCSHWILHALWSDEHLTTASDHIKHIFFSFLFFFFSSHLTSEAYAPVFNTRILLKKKKVSVFQKCKNHVDKT